MATEEFEEQAAKIAERIRTMVGDRRIAAACRGSANPAALAWLAEALELSSATTVVDLGAGLGGPLAWYRARYAGRGVAVEPSRPSAAGAASLFRLATVRASTAALPFRDGAFSAALMLGVVSVVDDPTTALRNARRVGGRLGVLDYCSTGSSTVCSGGSQFPTPGALATMVAEAGWTVEQLEHVDIGTPAPWREALEAIAAPPDPSEQEVTAAIERGAIAPVVLAAR